MTLHRSIIEEAGTVTTTTPDREENLVTHRQNGRRQIIPLCMAPAGETVELVEVQGGRKLRKRLADLGFNTGMPLRVVQSGLHGPLIVAVKEDTRLALGRGMAHRILVAASDRRQPHFRPPHFERRARRRHGRHHRARWKPKRW
jgi:Fe2+ transport system protein FeoA